MRRRAITGALLFIGVGVVLGATVLRTDIAQATGLAQAVTVDNTAANPVLVKEQRADANGNIKVHEQGTAAVHEQGTANVNLTNSSVTVASEASTKHEFNNLNFNSHKINSTLHLIRTMIKIKISAIIKITAEIIIKTEIETETETVTVIMKIKAEVKIMIKNSDSIATSI